MSLLKMYTLVKFDNNEYSVMPSKRVKIIQGENCIVKYPGGAKYNATIIHSADSQAIVTDLKNKLIEDNSSKKSGEKEDSNSSKCDLSKVKELLQKETLSTPMDNNIKRKANHSPNAFDPEAVTKKIKKELIDNFFSKTSDENVDNISSEVKNVIEKQSPNINLNDTYVANKRIDDGFDPVISSEKSNDNLEGSFAVASEETKLNKAINLHNEKSMVTISDNTTQGLGFSTPINGSIELDLDLPVIFAEDISDIAHRNQSTNSSSPPSGLTNQLELLGPNWPDVTPEDNSEHLQNIDDSPRPLRIIESDNELPEEIIIQNVNVQTVCDSKYQEKSDDSVNSNHGCSNLNNLNEEDQSQLNRTNDSSSEINQSTYDPSYEPSATISMTEDIAGKEKSLIEEKSSLLDDLPAVDVRELTVPVKDCGKGKSKKHFCIFCKTLQSKIARHFTNKHSDEAEVKKFKYLSAKHPDRRAAIDTLRKKGDFLHNNDKTLNTGILITPRRRSQKSKKVADDYTVCSSCKGHYAKSTIRFHHRRCNKSHKKRAKDILSSGRRMTGYIHDVACPKLRREIFPVLRDDDVVKCIRYDELIIKMGNKLCEKYPLVHQHDHIRAQLRLIGRLKLEMIKISPTFGDFKTLFKPENFDNVIIALKIVADWNPTTMAYNIPGNAQTLTTLLRKFAKKLRVEYVKENNEEQQKSVDNFLLLWDEEVPTMINKKAREDQVERKREKKITLPTKSDIKLLYDHLKKECSHCLNILDDKFDKDAWTLLNQATLISIQIFNRRRAGELERLKLINYTNKQTLADNLDASQYNNLSESSFNFAKQFVRLVLRGKLGREVSILLSPFDVECIEVLISFRDQAGVSSDNDYLFAVPNTNKFSKQYIRACPLMRRFANECGAAVPSSLSGTNLRKHIATYTAMLNVQETEVDRLAHFMGHSKEIHKNIYRIPVPVAEMTTVSHMLTSAIGNDNRLNNEQHEDSSSEEENSDSSDEEDNVVNSDLNNDSTSDIQNTSKECRPNTFGKSTRNKWTEGERYAINQEFGDLLKLSKLPSLKQCSDVIRKYKVLNHRTPQQVKTWIDNQRRAESRQKSYQSKKISS